MSTDSKVENLMEESSLCGPESTASQVEIPMEEDKKQLEQLKEVIHLVDEDKVFAWLESSNDSRSSAADTEDTSTFFPSSGTHPMWKEIAKGDLQSITDWIETTKREEGDIDEVDTANELNALCYAIIFKKKKIVRALLESGASANFIWWKDHTLLELAIFSHAPSREAMELLITHGTEIKTKALELAVDENKVEAAEVLIQHGVEVTVNLLKTPIKRQNRAMVGVLILDRNGHIDMERLKQRFTGDNSKQTPFIDLVANLPDVAEMVLDHCVTPPDITPPDERRDSIKLNCSLFDPFFANKFSRKIPCICWCQAISDIIRGKERKMYVYIKGEDEEYDSFEKHHHPLYNVMLSNDSRLLKHPVVLALLKKKLNTFGWLLYYFNLLVYILLVALLTVFILILPNPQDPKCLELRELEGNLSFSEPKNLTSRPECSMLGLDSHLSALTSLKAFALSLAILRLILELLQLYTKKVVGYFSDWVNWFELTEYIIIIIFLVNLGRSHCFCPQAWEWEVGVVSLALSWVVFIAWLQAMPYMGIYVSIMIRIMVSFARVAIFGVLLVIGFGLTFYLLFYQPPQGEIVNAPSSFSNPLRTMLSVISLTAGADTNGVFYDDSPPTGRQYESLAFIIWFAGVIIMNVLFINLLVGLAVGEVSEAKAEAEITIIKQRIELVLTQEGQFPEFIHKKIAQTELISVHPMNTQTLIYGLLLMIPVAGCIACNCLCCNNDYISYYCHIWRSIFKQENQSSKYKELLGLIEKTQLNTTAKVERARGEGTPVTKQDLNKTEQDLQNLKEQIKVMQDMLLHEIKKR